MYVVDVALSHSKRVEMGLKGIEMSQSYSGVYVKTVLAITEMSRDKLFHVGKCSLELLVLVNKRCVSCRFAQ